MPSAVAPVPVGGPRRPAGEVPANSRAPFDAGGAPAPAFAGFDYASPGAPGTASHYHVRVPDAGEVAARLSGNSGGARLRVRGFRVARAVDAAVAVREALGGKGAAEILDPALAGGCGGEVGHAAAAGRRPPDVRVVRVRLPADREPGLAAIPGLDPFLEADLGKPGAGEAWLDVHLVER